MGEENIGIVAVPSTASTVPETKVFAVVRLNLVDCHLLVLGDTLIVRRGRREFEGRLVDGEALHVGDEAVNIPLPVDLGADI